MTVQHKVNSIVIHSVQAIWSENPLRENPDGSVDYVPYATLSWSIAEMDADDFALMRVALKPTNLTSITTVDIDDRDAEATYTNVIVTDPPNGEHVGLLYRNVRVEMLIKVT